VCVALTGAFFAAPAERATARDLKALQAEAQARADEVSDLERRLSDLGDQEAELQSRIERSTVELAQIELQSSENRAALREATDRYVERAVAAYKAGPAADLAMFLSAETVGDLTALIEASTHAASVDADAVSELIAAREAAENAIEEIDERKQKLLSEQSRLDDVGDEIRTSLSHRNERLKKLTAEIEQIEEQARLAAQQAAAAGNISVDQALLDLLSPSGPTKGVPSGFASTGVSFEGVASWYGPGFEGNHTANGDIFDPNLYTAASKELPLGSWLYVEHQGRGVVVLVNDRGPYVGDRVLDLSRAAAFSIGITGLGWVKATILVKT
jgi:peptidoglycan hydrolase CwlO-like protein